MTDSQNDKSRNRRPQSRGGNTPSDGNQSPSGAQSAQQRRSDGPGSLGHRSSASSAHAPGKTSPGSLGQAGAGARRNGPGHRNSASLSADPSQAMNNLQHLIQVSTRAPRIHAIPRRARYTHAALLAHHTSPIGSLTRLRTRFLARTPPTRT